MVRTVDPAAHAVRREAFLDAAQRLIQTKGYGLLSIQDVIDDVSASKGAFSASTIYVRLDEAYVLGKRT